ncbi:AraC family transcriptional regulator [Ectopseudomonas mendocina]|uniref:AraC family transcriptional regulator n=1 Tax=Ectopseudomonas mendocina TaxID=300 RepID=A0ABZ2RJI2_ECTME
MVDRLAALMMHFPVSASVFNAGPLCGINTLQTDGVHGQLHLVRNGTVSVQYGRSALQIEEPSLLLFPRPLSHRFSTDPERGADMVCANLRLEGGSHNPIAMSLPDVICMPLTAIADSGPVLSLLFTEAFEQRCGRVAVIERLFEVVMIQVLRHLMESGDIRAGLMAGLSHSRLRNALVAMHEDPAREWTLEELAGTAGMSRSVFATAFRDTVGMTSGQYLQSWRVRLVQKALLSGRPLKVIVSEVGYGSEAALSRAFKAQTGLSPREWKNRVHASRPDTAERR